MTEEKNISDIVSEREAYKKEVIRQERLFARRSLSSRQWSEKSAQITDKVLTSRQFFHAHEIYIYVDYNREVYTRDILRAAWQAGKKIAVPKAFPDGTMIFYHIDSLQELRPGYKGIPEPACPRNLQEADGEQVLLIMPCTAFDARCHRLGYGKGFYDRYLQAHPRYQTLALAFDCQQVERIYPEATDQKPHCIITETKEYTNDN